MSKPAKRKSSGGGRSNGSSRSTGKAEEREGPHERRVRMLAEAVMSEAYRRNGPPTREEVKAVMDDQQWMEAWYAEYAREA